MNPHTQKHPLTWDLVLFFALYVTLPNYFAIDFSQHLPLLTGSRFLLVLIAVMLLIRRRNDIFNLRNFQVKQLGLSFTADRFLRGGILLYFALLLIADLALIPADAGEALKACFTLLVEGYMLLWLLSMILNTRAKLVAALGVLVLVSGITAIICIISTYLDKNLLHYLNTVNRKMLMSSYYRSGALRAAAGFGHPVFYGAFCAIILPINMYFVENAPNRRSRIVFAISMALTLTALALSKSRGSLAAYGLIMGLILFIRLIRRNAKKFFAAYIPIFAVMLVLLLLIPSPAPASTPAPDTTPQTVPSDTPSLPQTQEPITPVIPEDEPEPEPNPTPNTDFGENKSGMNSRFRQMTAIIWTLERKPVFGFGSNAHIRGLLKCQYEGTQWWTTRTLDMGITAIICQFGIVGLLGYCALYGSILKTVLSRKYRGDTLLEHLALAFLTYLLCLLTIAGLEKMDWVLFACIVCAVNTGTDNNSP